jgi:hypothetical protein
MGRSELKWEAGAGGRRSSVVGHQSCGRRTRHPPDRPTTDDRRPTTDDRRPTTDDRRPTTDDLYAVSYSCSIASL